MINPKRQYEHTLNILEISFIMVAPKSDGQEIKCSDREGCIFQQLRTAGREHHIEINRHRIVLIARWDLHMINHRKAACIGQSVG